MTKTSLILFCLLTVTGCTNTRVFIGNYDLVEIAVSDNQAKMVAENLPHKIQLQNGSTKRKIIGGHVSKKENNQRNNNSNPAHKDMKGEIHVSIICSDKDFKKEFIDGFHKSGFAVEKRFHSPYKKARIISEVIIAPKEKGHDSMEGKYYHTITLKTRGKLNSGTHRVLVEDPLAFIFLPANIVKDTTEVEMLITHPEYIEDYKHALENNTAIIPPNSGLQILSKMISSMKKSIRIVFTIS